MYHWLSCTVVCLTNTVTGEVCVYMLIAAGRTKRPAARWAEPPRRYAAPVIQAAVISNVHPVYSPLGLVVFAAGEGTSVRFTKGHNHFISNTIRCDCLRQDQCNNIACLQICSKHKCTGNWPLP